MRTAVLLSGGVDSSVALRLLQQDAGHRLTAFYLKIWLEDELSFLGDCPWTEDLEYARAVCRQAGVPLEVVPLQAEYLERVVEHALSELRAGRTPSPDIVCNRRIKFGAFWDYVGDDFDRVATGHYARVEAHGPHFLLRCSPDPIKDQTYFLSQLDQAQLARAAFPIGHLTKARVRSLAASLDLATRDRRDSQGICFLGRIDYRQFVRHRLGERPGEIREQGSDRRLGEHRGYWFHTIGQRFGLGLGGGPWFVTGKDIDRNVIFVAHATAAGECSRWTFEVAKVNWIGPGPGPAGLRVKLRHGPASTPCCLQGVVGGRQRVQLAEPDPGIAAGQHAVFYQGDRCLGGAAIADPAPPGGDGPVPRPSSPASPA